MQPSAPARNRRNRWYSASLLHMSSMGIPRRLLKAICSTPISFSARRFSLEVNAPSKAALEPGRLAAQERLAKEGSLRSLRSAICVLREMGEKSEALIGALATNQNSALVADVILTELSDEGSFSTLRRVWSSLSEGHRAAIERAAHQWPQPYRELLEYLNLLGRRDNVGQPSISALSILREPPSTSIPEEPSPTGRKNAPPIQVFIVSAMPDDEFLRILDNHLAVLKLQKRIQISDHRHVLPGGALLIEAAHHLQGADIVLLLISPDFFPDKTCACWIESTWLEHVGSRVVPVLVRNVDFEGTPLSTLQPLPQNRQFIVTRKNSDEAWHEVAVGVRCLVDELVKARNRS